MTLVEEPARWIGWNGTSGHPPVRALRSGRDREPRISPRIPVVLWAAVIFTLSSVPDLGTGLGAWTSSYGRSRTRRNTRCSARFFTGQFATRPRHFSSPPPTRSPTSSTRPSFRGGTAPRRLAHRHRRRRHRRRDRGQDMALSPVAIDLDGALGDTRPLWDDFLVDVARRYASIAPLDLRRSPRIAAPRPRSSTAGPSGGSATGAARSSVSRRTGRPSTSGRAPMRPRLSARWPRQAGGSAFTQTHPPSWPLLRWPTSEPAAASSSSSPARAPASASSQSSGPRLPSRRAARTSSGSVRVEAKNLDDRQLDAILERLDGLTAELHSLNKRLDHGEGLLRIAHELTTLERLAAGARLRGARPPGPAGPPPPDGLAPGLSRGWRRSTE